jgi:hypothetical protein
MSKKIDIFELFNFGVSGDVAFGKTPWEYFKKLEPDLHLTENEFKSSTIPIMAETSDYKVHFTFEAKPALEGIRLLFSYPAGIWGGSKPSDANLCIPRIGRYRPALSKYKWHSIQTLPAAIREFHKETYFWRSGHENQIFLVWVKGKRRMTLEYTLEAHPADGNKYAFDYYLTGAAVEDMSRSKISKQRLKQYFFGN